MNALDVVTNPAEARALIKDNLPEGSFRRIVLKPNWVKHQERPEFPIEALVTSSQLIDLVIELCLAKYANLESILIGDVPLQSCEWEKLVDQAGIQKLIDKYRGTTRPKVEFLDLRKERWRERDGFLHLDSSHPGDPAGYAEVVLDETSFLEPISDRADLFRVSDYDPEEIHSVHRKQSHRYLIARSILEADLLINLPKMKTHQKAGLTGALKNLVGINGSKAYLVHHRKGFPSQGGDEFPEHASRLVYYQVRMREILQKRSRVLFSALRPAWQLAKKLRGIETVGTPENLESSFYVGSGSWYGNDSIWRMIYDLNTIILFAGTDGGRLKTAPQRTYLAILDGIVSGEGNGPLQPLVVNSGIVAASDNPFLIDFGMSKLMGFDYNHIPVLAQKRFFPQAWANFDPDSFSVCLDGKTSSAGLEALPVLRSYLPPPGWKGQIELTPAL